MYVSLSSLIISHSKARQRQPVNLARACLDIKYQTINGESRAAKTAVLGFRTLDQGSPRPRDWEQKISFVFDRRKLSSQLLFALFLYILAIFIDFKFEANSTET
ncbi:hypothetical protein S83_043422 [Arachis hypogaea]